MDISDRHRSVARVHVYNSLIAVVMKSAETESFRQRFANAASANRAAADAIGIKAFDFCANIATVNPIALAIAIYTVGIERACFARSKNIGEYSAHVFRLVSFASAPGFELIGALADGRLEPEQAPFASIEEMCPSILREEREEYRSRVEQKGVVKVSTAYLCAKCGRREATFSEILTRSPDEPPTLFICCLSCGHRWSIN